MQNDKFDKFEGNKNTPIPIFKIIKFINILKKKVRESRRAKCAQIGIIIETERSSLEDPSGLKTGTSIRSGRSISVKSKQSKQDIGQKSNKNKKMNGYLTGASRLYHNINSIPDIQSIQREEYMSLDELSDKLDIIREESKEEIFDPKQRRRQGILTRNVMQIQSERGIVQQVGNQSLAQIHQNKINSSKQDLSMDVSNDRTPNHKKTADLHRLRSMKSFELVSSGT